MEIKNDCCRSSLTDPVIYIHNIHNIYLLHHNLIMTLDTDGKQK